MFEATRPVRTVGVERLFLGGTLDHLLLDLDVCLLTLDWVPGTEKMGHVGVLWGVGGVQGGAADAEAVNRDNGFQSEVVVSVECSAEEEEEGCVPGSHGRSKGPLRVQEGERGALDLGGSGVEGCQACNTDPHGVGKGRLERTGHLDDGTRPGNAGHLGEGETPQGKEGEKGEEGEDGEVAQCHMADHRD